MAQWLTHSTCIVDSGTWRDPSFDSGCGHRFFGRLFFGVSPASFLRARIVLLCYRSLGVQVAVIAHREAALGVGGEVRTHSTARFRAELAICISPLRIHVHPRARIPLGPPLPSRPGQQAIPFGGILICDPLRGVRSLRERGCIGRRRLTALRVRFFSCVLLRCCLRLRVCAVRHLCGDVRVLSPVHDRHAAWCHVRNTRAVRVGARGPPCCMATCMR